MKLGTLAAAAAAVLIVAAMLAAPAAAGGWAVVTLDELPPPAVAGQPIHLGFMVRQHGQTPWEYDTVLVRATLAGGSLTVVEHATETLGEPGHYEAELTLLEPGRWDWVIESGLGPGAQPMPPLLVTLHPILLTAGGQDGLRAASAARLHGAAHAAYAAQQARLAAQPGAESPAEVGQALFLAKGCIICHPHAAVAEQRASFAGFAIGPELTQLKADPTFLHAWLKDPSAVKPGTFMPTLGLSDPEIDSLIAFLSENEEGTAQR
jgi:cytochrome c2